MAKSDHDEEGALPWWVGLARQFANLRSESWLRFVLRLSIFAIICVVVIVVIAAIATAFFDFRIVGNQVYFGPLNSSPITYAWVDAAAGFQNSGCFVSKAERVLLEPEGQVHAASDQIRDLARIVKPLIVNGPTGRQWPDEILRRYPPVEVSESVLFYRDWTGPEGESEQSDILEECKLRRELGWGALLAVVLPFQSSPRQDPFEVMDKAHLSPADLVAVPRRMELNAERDGWLTFIVNEAVMSPFSSSSDSVDYYGALKVATQRLSGDPRHRIPMSSIPFIWYSDNAGAFRVKITRP